MYKKHISLYPKIMVWFFHAGVDGIRRAKTFQIRRILMTNGEDVISSNWIERGNILRAKLHCHFCSTSSFSLTAALIRKVRSRFMRLTKYV